MSEAAPDSQSQPGLTPPADIVSTPRGGGRRWKPRVVRDGEVQSAMVLLAKGKLARPSKAFSRRLREIEERLDEGKKLSAGDVAYLRARAAARLATSLDPKDVVEALRVLEDIALKMPLVPVQAVASEPEVRKRKVYAPLPPPIVASDEDEEEDLDDLDLPG